MRLSRTALGGVLVLLLTGCGPYLVYKATEPEPSPPPGLVVPEGIRPDVLFPPGPSVHGWEVGANDVVLRVDVQEGYDGRDDLVSFDRHGWVVRAADTSVFGTKEDYTTWRIDRAGLAATLDAFDRLGVREPAADFGDDGVGPGVRHVRVQWTDRAVERSVSGSLPLWEDDAGRPGQPLWDLASQVVDPAWHADHVIVEPRRWVPSAIGLRARAPGGTGSPNTDEPFARWPLRRDIRELSHGVAAGPYGEPERLLCLRGRAAARVFDLLVPGVNTAWLRVDDGRRWEVTLEVVLPAYVTLDNPCGSG